MSAPSQQDPLASLYMQTPPPLFSFAKKTQKIDWQAIEKVDVDKEIVQDQDISLLENLLTNITSSEL